MATGFRIKPGMTDLKWFSRDTDSEKSALAGRRTLGQPAPDPVVIESVAEFMQRVARLEWDACPHCGNGHFVLSAPLPPTGRAGVSYPMRGIASRGPP